MGRGVVMIQGRHIFSEGALLNVSDVRIWLDEDNRECMRQVLMERGEWHLGPNSTENEDEYLHRKALAKNGELLLFI